MSIHRTSLIGQDIPTNPPNEQDFSFPRDLHDILPEPFHNLLESIATSGSEFAHFIRKYQFDEHTPYYNMSALLASFQIVNYNVKSLQGGFGHITPDEKETIGEPRLQRISEAVQRIDAHVEPYRAALNELEKKGTVEMPKVANGLPSGEASDSRPA